MAVVMKMMNTLWLFNVATVWEMAPTQLDEDDDDDNDDDNDDEDDDVDDCGGDD
jgi:hypothetical protein